MSKPPRLPYPPDLTDDGADATTPHLPTLDDLTDVALCDVDWAGARALRAAAQRVELLRCRLTGAELGEASLRDVRFDECRLDLVGLRHARLERVAFRDCRMSECDLSGATLADVLFERCELREASFSSARLLRVELRGCDLADMRGADALRGARMPWEDVLASAPVLAAAVGVEIVE